MNANELADWLENECEEVFPNQQDIVDMLRQQQAEIANLKAGLLSHRDIYPVELTDEEIEEVEKSCKKPLASWAWKVEFARAILRKAQEK